MRRFLWLSVSALLLACIAVASSGAKTQLEARWVITDLGTLGGSRSAAVDINEKGWIVGWSDTTSGRRHAVLWVDGRMTDLDVPGGRPHSYAVAINEHGQVIGDSARIRTRYGDFYQRHPFVWQRGVLREIDSFPSGQDAWVVDINEHGTVVVGSDGMSDLKYWERSFVWRSGKMRDLGTLGGSSTHAVAINERGQVVGYSCEERSSDCSLGQPFLWRDGTMRKVEPPPLGWTRSGKRVAFGWAMDINERGQIVGSVAPTAPENGWDHAFIWEGGRMRDLGTAVAGARWHPKVRSSALAVNERGEVVGWSKMRSKGRTHAVLWRRGQVIDLLPDAQANSGAFAINDSGVILGYGGLRGEERPLVWRDGEMMTLGTLPGGKESGAVALNNHDQIVGWSETRSGARHAVLWTLKG